MFQPVGTHAVRWRPVDGEGLEHLTLSAGREGIRADSVVIGDRGGAPYGVRYRIDCDASWCVRSFSVETTTGKRIAMVSDGEGHWHDEAGAHLAGFDGCLDIDLAGSPFTNTLPIRRLNLRPGSGTVRLTMVYVPFDSFDPIVDGQCYTCLEGGLFLYQAEDRTFQAKLPVDGFGLVLDCPGLFERA